MKFDYLHPNTFNQNKKEYIMITYPTLIIIAIPILLYLRIIMNDNKKSNR